MDCSLPGSSVHGISQSSILEWAAISCSRGSSWPRDWTQVSCTVGRFFTNWTIRESLTYTSFNFSHPIIFQFLQTQLVLLLKAEPIFRFPFCLFGFLFLCFVALLFLPSLIFYIGPIWTNPRSIVEFLSWNAFLTGQSPTCWFSLPLTAYRTWSKLLILAPKALCRVFPNSVLWPTLHVVFCCFTNLEDNPSLSRYMPSFCCLYVLKVNPPFGVLSTSMKPFLNL